MASFSSNLMMPLDEPTAKRRETNHTALDIEAGSAFKKQTMSEVDTTDKEGSEMMSNL